MATGKSLHQKYDYPFRKLVAEVENCRKVGRDNNIIIFAGRNTCLRLTYIVLCFCFVFLRRVYPMLPVSLD